MTDRNFELVEFTGPLDADSEAELAARIEHLSDEAGIRTLILHFAGVSGPDLTDPAAASEFSRRGRALAALIEGLGKPVIAAFEGEVLDAGLELALACHWRIATADARFGFTSQWLLPGLGGGARLARTAGRSRALELILTRRRISAAEALSAGIVNTVLPDHDRLIQAATDLAARLGSNAPLAMKYALEAINSGADMPLDDALRLESALFALCFSTEDVREGTRAFLEKRPPRFEGR